MPGEVCLGKALLGKAKIPTGKVQVPALPALRVPFDAGETCYTAYNEIFAPVTELVRPFQAYPVTPTLSLCSAAIIAIGDAPITPNFPFFLVIK